MALSEYADWWDQQKAISENFLTEWVQENPQWWAVGIAATVQTTMDVGAGMVDVLRLGEGAAEGGWRGYGKDALRCWPLSGRWAARAACFPGSSTFAWCALRSSLWE